MKTKTIGPGSSPEGRRIKRPGERSAPGSLQRTSIRGTLAEAGCRHLAATGEGRGAAELGRIALVIVLALAACGPSVEQREAEVRERVEALLKAFDERDFATAHSMLSAADRERHPRDRYVARHAGATDLLRGAKLSYTIRSVELTGDRAHVVVTYEIPLELLRMMRSVVGASPIGVVEGTTVEREFNLAREEDGWRVVLSELESSMEEQFRGR